MSAGELGFWDGLELCMWHCSFLGGGIPKTLRVKVHSLLALGIGFV